jgi:predicted ATPase
VPLPGELAEAPELIGRRRELTWLDSDLVAARSGSLKIALIGGEAGIGKTTMLAAFARAHLDAGNVVAFGRCPEGEAVPLEPFGGIVAALVEHLPLDILQEHSERCGGELQRIAPRLGNRLWVPPPVTSDVASERHQLFDAITDLLRRVAWAGSLTLILDDLHWAEPSALHLLRHLSRSLLDAPVLVVASYRDAPSDSTPELRAALADLDRGRCRSISLGGFDDAELGRLAQSVVGPVRRRRRTWWPTCATRRRATRSSRCSSSATSGRPSSSRSPTVRSPSRGASSASTCRAASSMSCGPGCTPSVNRPPRS